MTKKLQEKNFFYLYNKKFKISHIYVFLGESISRSSLTSPGSGINLRIKALFKYSQKKFEYLNVCTCLG